MPNTHTPVEVTQEDREAAASLWIYVDGDIPTPAILNEAERYRQGVYDHTPAVCAFAHHRIASTRTVDGELLEALKEAVAQYGKQGGPWNVPSDPGGWLDRARAAIAKATGHG